MTLNAEQQQAILDANSTLAAENDALKEKIWAAAETTRMVAVQAHKELLIRDALIASMLRHLSKDSIDVDFLTGGQIEIRIHDGKARVSLQKTPSEAQA